MKPSFLLMLISINFLQAQTATIPEWKVMNEPAYSISYPVEWLADQSGQMGTSFILYSPIGAGGDQFRENVNLIIQDLTGNKMTLDQFVELSEGQVKTFITNAELLESERIKKDGNEFHKIIYNGDQGKFNLKFEQYYYIIDQKAYILTLTCEITKFDEYKVTGEKILNSFKIK